MIDDGYVAWDQASGQVLGARVDAGHAELAVGLMLAEPLASPVGRHVVRLLGVVTVAGFVAENRLGELAARRAWPAPGLYEGVEHQGGVAFAWRVQVSSTPHPLFRRVEVRVAHPATPSHELRRLVGVLPKEG